MFMNIYIYIYIYSIAKVTNARCDLFIVQWYLKEIYDLSELPFGSSVIVRLFHRRFFYRPTVFNGRRVPLDMTDSKRKRN